MLIGIFYKLMRWKISFLYIWLIKSMHKFLLVFQKKREKNSWLYFQSVFYSHSFWEKYLVLKIAYIFHIGINCLQLVFILQNWCLYWKSLQLISWIINFKLVFFWYQNIFHWHMFLVSIGIKICFNCFSKICFAMYCLYARGV